MKASWEKIEKNVGVLEVEVDEAKVASALDKAFKKVVNRVNVPGFRRGKVPRQLFEKRFGVESLYQEAIDILLPEAYVQAVEEAGIEPVDRPEVDIEQFAKGQPMKFKAKVTVKPEVKLGEYKGLEVEVQDDEVSDEEVAEELKRQQQRYAELVPAEEGAAKNGDVAVIDFEGFVEGEAFQGGKAEKYSLELGSGSFIPGFEDQIVGMEKGQEKDVNVTFPETYHVEELKGKAAVFKVKLHDIKHKVLPELDDEFAKDVSEFETLDEYKQDIKSRLSERKRESAKAALETAVVEKAAANAEVDIPAAMINHEVDHMLRDFERRIRSQGMTLDLYYKFSGQSEDALKEQMRGEAEKRVRNNLVLEAIAKAEKVEATEADVEAELQKIANSMKLPVAEVRAAVEGNGNLEGLKQDIVVRKTVEFLVENSKQKKAKS
jgi:trigger factor